MLDSSKPASGLPPTPKEIVRFAGDMRPALVVVVDTEEDFDWYAPFSRDNVSVQSAGHLGVAQKIFERHGVCPTYAVDYPVASQNTGTHELREWADDGLCDIGTQCHAWVNPPFDEELSVENTYAGNLPPSLEAEKLKVLTETIAEKFGRRPTTYRAGRYGIGGNTAGILSSLGYNIDMSVYAHRNFSGDHGPDFSAIGPAPFWLESGGDRLLEIPLTSGFFGPLRHWGREVYSALDTPALRAIRLSGIGALLGVLNRATLTPEGIPLREAKALTRALLRDGQKVFSLSFHSPSLVPGNTPYVRSEADLEALLAWLEDYFSFFFDELGGVPATPGDILNVANNDRTP